MENTANLADAKASITGRAAPRHELDLKRPSLDAYRTKTELLTHAKDLIAEGDQAHVAEQWAFRDAAEAMTTAINEHGASQKECAKAVGKSETWVSRLLKWRAEGYRDHSPFGPTTKAGRVAHAQVGAGAGAVKRTKAKAKKAPAGQERPDHEATGSVESEPPGAAGELDTAAALIGFKKAVDQFFPVMNDADKVEATKYFIRKTGARVR